MGERWLVFHYDRGELFKVSVCLTKRGAARSAGRDTKLPDSTSFCTTKTIKLSHIEALLMGVDFAKPAHRRMMKTIQ